MKKMLLCVLLMIVSSATFAYENIEFINTLRTSSSVNGTIKVVESNKVTYGWVLTQLCAADLCCTGHKRNVSDLAKMADEIIAEIEKREAK